MGRRLLQIDFWYTDASLTRREKDFGTCQESGQKNGFAPSSVYCSYTNRTQFLAMNCITDENIYHNHNRTIQVTSRTKYKEANMPNSIYVSQQICMKGVYYFSWKSARMYGSGNARHMVHEIAALEIKVKNNLKKNLVIITKLLIKLC